MISNVVYATILQRRWSNAKDHVVNISVSNVYLKLKISVIDVPIGAASLSLQVNCMIS